MLEAALPNVAGLAYPMRKVRGAAQLRASGQRVCGHAVCGIGGCGA
jgi:hypothetical protein